MMRAWRALRFRPGPARRAFGSAAPASAEGAAAARADAAECDRLVKTFDYENYLATMFLPEARRSAALAVRAYNVELATVRDSARGNALTGRIRFQFWREVLDEIYAGGGSGKSAVDRAGGRANHPVGRALARAVHDYGLQRRWLDRMLVAREQELDNVELSDMGDFEEYAEAVGGSLMYSTLECATDVNVGAGLDSGRGDDIGRGGGCSQSPLGAVE